MPASWSDGECRTPSGDVRAKSHEAPRKISKRAGGTHFARQIPAGIRTCLEEEFRGCDVCPPFGSHDETNPPMPEMDTSNAYPFDGRDDTMDLLGSNHPPVGPAATVAMGRIDVPPPDFLDSIDSRPTMPPRPPPDGSTATFINATQATVAITTTTAPTIAGLGRIEPSRFPAPPRRKAIRVPTYSCNGGLDTKFNPSPSQAKPSHLFHLLTPDEYSAAIEALNDKIKRSRAKSLDVVLLATGPLLLPLALWGARHNQQAKRRKKLIEEGIWEFNRDMEGRGVKMVWNKSSMEDYLTIEEATTEDKGGKMD